MRIQYLLIALCCATYTVARDAALKEMHKDIADTLHEMHEAMQDELQRSQEEMRTFFKQLSQDAEDDASGTRISHGRVGLDFEEADDKLHMRVQLPQEVAIDTDSINADVADNDVSITIPYADKHGEVSLDVSDNYVQVATKHAVRHTSENKDAQDHASQHAVYNTQSHMMQSLPERINPASILQDDGSITISYDEDENVITLPFAKRHTSKPVTVNTQKTSSKHADEKNTKASSQEAAQKDHAESDVK